MISILHIALDEKFIDVAFKYFEKVAPGYSRVVVISNSNKLKFIKTTPVEVFTNKTIFNILNSITNYDIVVFHSLFPKAASLIKKIPKEIKTLWIGFGHDYYDLILPPEKLYLKETKKILGKKFLVKELIKRFSLINHIRLRKKVNLSKKINYFCPVIKEEYNLIKTEHKDFGPLYIDWNYNIDWTACDGIVASGKNILVGNSAFPTNNHLDIFKILTKIDLSNRMIVCPLSYGDSKYKEKIIEQGFNQFGKKFKPIVEFIPIDKYVDLLRSCSVVIMNHQRQQAAGNIAIMMNLGAKIFLRKENPLYQHLIKNGAIVFELNKIVSFVDKDIEPISTYAHKKNKEVIKQWIAPEVIIKKTESLIKAIS